MRFADNINTQKKWWGSPGYLARDSDRRRGGSPRGGHSGSRSGPERIGPRSRPRDCNAVWAAARPRAKASLLVGTIAGESKTSSPGSTTGTGPDGPDAANEAKDGRSGGGSIKNASVGMFSTAVTHMPFCQPGMEKIVPLGSYFAWLDSAL